MVMLVTLEQAKAHLRVDGDYDDSDIALKIHAASGAVMNYLKTTSFLNDSGGVIVSDDGAPAVPFEVAAATLMLLGILYRDRDGQEMDEWTLGYLPMPVQSLLYPLRDPTCA